MNVNLWFFFCRQISVEIQCLDAEQKVKVLCKMSTIVHSKLLNDVYCHVTNQFMCSYRNSAKVLLFIDRCRWQNFHPSVLRLMNNCVEFIYKTQKTELKVLSSATVGE